MTDQESRMRGLRTVLLVLLAFTCLVIVLGTLVLIGPAQEIR